MALSHSYSFIAPIYDMVVSKATHAIRISSLEELRKLSKAGDRILISGIGTGLDIPHLPKDRRYVGIDITPAMLKHAQRRATNIDIELKVGDAMHLPLENASFDIVVMHLILAVVPNPALALQEAQRVVKKNGYIIIMDKFLKPGQLAPFRRMINPLIKNIATQTNVVFEHVLKECSQLELKQDEPVLAGAWFRRIVLQKRNS